MERVQITGGANGVYTDTQGRRLYTMGDYSPAIGDWVWTNGTTIYGHQSAGELPLAAIMDSAVLPVILRKKNENGEYVTYGSELFWQLSPDARIKEIADASISVLNYISDSSHAYLQTDSGDWYNIITGENLGRFSITQIAIADNGDLVSIYYYGGYYNNGGDQGLYDLTPIYNRKIFRKTDSAGRSLQNWKAHSPDDSRQDPYIEFRRNGKLIQKVNLSGVFSAAIEKVRVETEKLHEGGDDSGSDVITSPYYARPEYLVWGTVTITNNPGFFKSDGSYRAYVHIGMTGQAYPWVTVKGAAGKKVRYWLNSVDNNYSATYTVESGRIQLTSESGWEIMNGYSYPAPPIKKTDYEKEKEDGKDVSFKPFENEEFTAIRWVDDEYPFKTDDGTIYYNSYYVFGGGWNYYPDAEFVSGRLWNIKDTELYEAWQAAGLSRSITYVDWNHIVFYSDYSCGNGYYYETDRNYTKYFKDRAGNTIFTIRSSDSANFYFNSNGAPIRICKSGAGYWLSTGSNLLYVLNEKIVFHTGYDFDTGEMQDYILNTNIWSLTPFKRKRKLTKAIQKLAGIIEGNS